MENQIEFIKNTVVVKLNGEIDQHAATRLRDRIDIEIVNSPGKNLIIDLDGVTLMDSSGIGLIVGRYKNVKSLGGNLALSGGNDYIRKMIDLSGIKKIVNMYSSIEDAKKSFEKN